MLASQSFQQSLHWDANLYILDNYLKMPIFEETLIIYNFYDLQASNILHEYEFWRIISKI